MWMIIVSLMVGGVLGFFLACILTASARRSELDPRLDESAIGEPCDQLLG